MRSINQSTRITRSHVAPAVIAIVAHMCIACGGDDHAKLGDSAASRVNASTPTPSPIPGAAPLGDTALTESELPAMPPVPPAATSAPPANRAPTDQGQPVTAPAEHAAAPAVNPVPPDMERHAPAAESVAVTPRVAPPPTGVQHTTPAEPVRRPFEVGERLVYDVKFGPLSVGTATMEVLGIEQVRGIPAYHIVFEVRGGNRLYRVEDRYESWFDVRTLASLRYVQNIREGGYRRNSVFEIHPDRRVYVEGDGEPQPSVAQPLDEGSFIYWMRTIPLEVGQAYSFNHYFRPDRNPVRVTVVRRERVKVPAGEFDAIVLQPVIQTKGLLSEAARTEIWLSDDDRRMLLKMESHLKFGTLSLHLRNTQGLKP